MLTVWVLRAVPLTEIACFTLGERIMITERVLKAFCIKNDESKFYDGMMNRWFYVLRRYKIIGDACMNGISWKLDDGSSY